MQCWRSSTISSQDSFTRTDPTFETGAQCAPSCEGYRGEGFGLSDQFRIPFHSNASVVRSQMAIVHWMRRSFPIRAMNSQILDWAAV